MDLDVDFQQILKNLKLIYGDSDLELQSDLGSIDFYDMITFMMECEKYFNVTIHDLEVELLCNSNATSTQAIEYFYFLKFEIESDFCKEFLEKNISDLQAYPHIKSYLRDKKLKDVINKTTKNYEKTNNCDI